MASLDDDLVGCEVRGGDGGGDGGHEGGGGGAAAGAGLLVVAEVGAAVAGPDDGRADAGLRALVGVARVRLAAVHHETVQEGGVCSR